MIPMLAIVRRKEPDKEHNVSTSDEGTIVDILANGEAYVVEFFDQDGNTNMEALFTEYREDQLEIIK